MNLLAEFDCQERMTSEVLRYLFINLPLFREKFVDVLFPVSRISHSNFDCIAEHSVSPCDIANEKKKRVDLKLESDDYVVYIENKHWAFASEVQLKNYLEALKREERPAKMLVLLVPELRKTEASILVKKMNSEMLKVVTWNKIYDICCEVSGIFDNDKMLSSENSRTDKAILHIFIDYINTNLKLKAFDREFYDALRRRLRGRPNKDQKIFIDFLIMNLSQMNCGIKCVKTRETVNEDKDYYGFYMYFGGKWFYLGFTSFIPDHEKKYGEALFVIQHPHLEGYPEFCNDKTFSLLERDFDKERNYSTFMVLYQESEGWWLDFIKDLLLRIGAIVEI